jgi:hypothetical protein
MCVRRAQQVGPDLARLAEIIEVGATAGDKAPILDPPDWLTDAELLHGTSLPSPDIGAKIGFATAGGRPFHTDAPREALDLIYRLKGLVAD